MATVQFKKNFWKCLFLTGSIALLSLTAGGSRVVIIVNSLYIFVLSMVATNVVDGLYYWRELRKIAKEVKKHG